MRGHDRLLRIIVAFVVVQAVQGCGNGICRTPFGVEYTGGSCGDQICNNYGLDPRFDDSDRPPNAEALGRATWTVLHTTAAYLPDRLSPVEKQGFVALASSVATLYPGVTQVYAEALRDPSILAQLDDIATREDAQLWTWRVHNTVMAALFPAREPFPPRAGLSASLFDLHGPAAQDLVLSPALRKTVLAALDARWRLTDAPPEAKDRDRLDLPPDRDTIGRAYWTYAHAASVYIARRPSPAELAAFRAVFETVSAVYPCSDCRENFVEIIEDAVIQQELDAVETRHDAILFVWKVHNAVTAAGLSRGQWTARRLFPPSKTLDGGLGKFNASEFLAGPPAGAGAPLQLRLGATCDTSTPTCLDGADRYEVLADVQSRWEIEGGIDLPLNDDAPTPACPAPTDGQPPFRLDMFVMGKCPWCANAMEDIADLIQCDFRCEWEGRGVSARLDFQLHFVGLNNGTWAAPSLTAIHGPAELVAERLVMCARKHYSKDYQYIRFMKCMDANVTLIPATAPECAAAHGLDLGVLTACANAHGNRLVAQSYGFASWMGIDTVPTFVLAQQKQILGLPKNFTDVVCEQIVTTRAALAAR
eukprot:CAMPEP_0172174820 /NCGR_PEP_ID=MMETSP1050-20130122/13881_1 /TAXON_ID=233186 /ORGANISM="Cryptomonas curvata, Strain CCAP979/52" /LENGTH=589 /DNA_ID=CAMNT_0012846847 /DNA_START=196 /DNA_END=1961 /DNA_ORIENTATION=+